MSVSILSLIDSHNPFYHLPLVSVSQQLVVKNI